MYIWIFKHFIFEVLGISPSRKFGVSNCMCSKSGLWQIFKTWNRTLRSRHNCSHKSEVDSPFDPLFFSISRQPNLPPEGRHVLELIFLLFAQRKTWKLINLFLLTFSCGLSGFCFFSSLLSFSYISSFFFMTGIVYQLIRIDICAELIKKTKRHIKQSAQK